MESHKVTLNNDELIYLLQAIVSPKPNNEEIKKAQDMLKKYNKNILSVEGYLLQSKNNPDPLIRQLAATLLDRKLEKHWQSMDQDTQKIFKNLILEIYATEKTHLVLKSIANLIFRIAKLNLINGESNDLLDMIFTDPGSYNQDQAGLFELNLYILAQLIENCSFYIKPKLGEIRKIIEAGLKSGTNKMKENATKCLGNLVRSLEKEELPMFKDIIPYIFNEIKNFNSDTILHIYETLCDFHLNSLSFFEEYFDKMIPLTVELIQDENYDGNVRLVLSEFLLMIAECKKKIFTKNQCQFLKLAITIAYKLASTDEKDNEMDSDQLSNFNIGMRMLDSFSQIISSKYIFPICTDFIQKLLVSTNEYERRAAISSFGCLAEGCTEKMKDNLGDIVNTLINMFLNDPSVPVKTASIVSMDYLTQYCSPDIIDYHDKILPMLVYGLNSSDEEVIEKSLIELNFFCQNLDVELEGYIGELLPKLILLLENHKSVKIQQECLFALASVISSAQTLIGTTLLPIIETCSQILVNRKSENENELRANSLNCVAKIAFVIKYEAFKPYMEFFSNFALEFIKTNVYEFQEAGFSYFAALSKIMGKEFATCLPNLMEIALVVIKDDSGVHNGEDKDELGLDSDSEEEDEKGIGDVYVNETFVDAKCSVILAITTFARACPHEFMAYLERVINSFESLWDYIHDNVNVELIQAYEELLIVLDEAEILEDGEKLYKKAWMLQVLPKYETIIKESDLKEEVVKVLESINGLIDHFGASLFVNNNSLTRIIELTKMLLDYKAMCQVKNDDEEDLDDIDHDEQILGGVVDIYLILSEKIGNEFHICLTQVFDSLKKYLAVSRSEADRSMIFGCFADMLKYSKTSVKFYISLLYTSVEENITKNQKKKNDDLYRHIAYLIGILFESDPEAAAPYFLQSLNYLQTIFENSGKMGKDNVIASLCRIALHYTGHELFPKIVDTIFKNIPLQNDSFENVTVIKFIIAISDKLDIATFEAIFEKVMLTIKMLVLMEIKCGTTKALIKDIKNYLELLNGNETIKLWIENGLVKYFNELEKERFVNTIRNI
jgi:hypothetical protein